MGKSLKDLESAFKSDAAAAKAEVDQVDESQLNEALGTTDLSFTQKASSRFDEFT